LGVSREVEDPSSFNSKTLLEEPVCDNDSQPEETIAMTAEVDQSLACALDFPCKY
jgi:hypothetical protein